MAKSVSCKATFYSRENRPDLSCPVRKGKPYAATRILIIGTRIRNYIHCLFFIKIQKGFHRYF